MDKCYILTTKTAFYFLLWINEKKEQRFPLQCAERNELRTVEIQVSAHWDC